MDAPISFMDVSRQSARERDLDNLMLEELASSPEFREWFLGRLAAAIDVPSHAQARVRKNERREAEVGQTDLGLALLDQAGEELCLVLIENKVHSTFQEGQPERYRDEVRSARTRLGDRCAAAVLIAPETNHHVRRHLGSSIFDAEITIEQVIGFLEMRADELSGLVDGDRHAEEIASRLRNKVILLNSLLGKGTRQSWSPRRDPERLSFMAEYRALAEHALGRDFEITASSGGKGSTTVIFTPRRERPGGLPVQNIRHDFGGKHEVSLVLREFGARADAVRASLGALPDALVEKGKPSRVPGRDASLMIRLSCPEVDVSRAPVEQRNVLAQVFAAVGRLLDWAVANGGPARDDR